MRVHKRTDAPLNRDTVMKKRTYAQIRLGRQENAAWTAALAFQRSPSPETVHDFRLAVRRLRTLLKAFAPLCGKSLRVVAKGTLKQTSHRLGHARDAHIFQTALASLARRSALLRRAVRPWNRALAHDERHCIAITRRRLPRYFSTERPRVAASDVETAGAPPPSYRRWAYHRLRRQQKRFAHAIGRVTDADSPGLHRSRIQAKRLRYLAETLSDDFGPAETLVERLEEVQDKLGGIHDLQALEERLHRSNKVGSRPAHPLDFELIEAAREARERLFRRYWKSLAAAPDEVKEDVKKLKP